MSLTFFQYVDKYAKKPNPATGRSFWYDAEIAQAEGVAESVVGEYSRFYQTFVGDAKLANKPKPLQAEIVAAWERTQYERTKAAATAAVRQSIAPYPAGTSTLGYVTVGQLENIIEKVVRRVLGETK